MVGYSIGDEVTPLGVSVLALSSRFDGPFAQLVG